MEPVADPDDAAERPTSTVPTAPTAVVDAGGSPVRHVRLFGTPAFFRLWLAQVVASLGDWIGFLAITLLAKRLGTGSEGAAIGLVMTARIVPGLLLAPIAGVLVDRWDRKKVLVACHLGRAAVMCTLPYVDTVAGLVLASLAMEVMTLLWSPAKEASVPNLVPTHRLASANSLSLAAAYGTLPAASLAFAVLAWVQEDVLDLDVLSLDRPGTLAFYVGAATFVGSALLIATIGLGPSTPRPTPVGEGSRRFAAAVHELREGWSFIFVNPMVRAVNVGLATGLIGGGMVVPLGAPFVEDVLGAGASGYGLFVTALGIGAAIGIVTVSFVQRHLPKDVAFTIAVFGAGTSLFGATAGSTLGPALGLVVVFGFCAGTAYVLGFTILHENVDDELRGRIFSALYVLVRLCLLIAFAVGPFLSDALHRLSGQLLDDRHLELPGGLEVFLPGERLTLWIGALVIVLAGFLALLSVRAEHLRARLAIRNGR